MSISPTKLLVLSIMTRENKDEKPTDCTLDYKSQPISLNKGDRISLFCYSILIRVIILTLPGIPSLCLNITT